MKAMAYKYLYPSQAILLEIPLDNMNDGIVE
jgi:hypothetical protein